VDAARDLVHGVAIAGLGPLEQGGDLDRFFH
jgi:hypothetical protein